MAKRFIDSEIFDKAGFVDASLKIKLLTIFVFSKCDCIGVFKMALPLVQAYIGEPIIEQDILSIPLKIEKLKEGVYWLVDFCQFQYGPLSENCRPHKKYIQMLKEQRLYDRVYKGYSKGIQTLQEKEKEKDKDKDKDKNKGESDFDLFWKIYPKKKSKGQAKKTWDKLKKAKKLPELAVLQDAIALAKQSQDWQRDKGQYIPHPSTWLNAEGWLDNHKVDLNSEKHKQSVHYCAIDKKPATHEIKTGVYLCDECKKLLNKAPNFKTFKGQVIPKSKLNTGQIEKLILDQRAKEAF